MANDKWQTPAWILDAVRAFGGGDIGLDPCTDHENCTNAKNFYSDERGHDGLDQQWQGFGLVFVNPPYSRGNLDRWTSKCKEESRDWTTEIIALVPVATSTKWWQINVGGGAMAICFLDKRVKFVGGESGARFDSALVYYGPRTKEFADAFDGFGWVVML